MKEESIQRYKELVKERLDLISRHRNFELRMSLGEYFKIVDKLSNDIDVAYDQMYLDILSDGFEQLKFCVGNPYGIVNELDCILDRIRQTQPEIYGFEYDVYIDNDDKDLIHVDCYDQIRMRTDRKMKFVVYPGDENTLKVERVYYNQVR